MVCGGVGVTHYQVSFTLQSKMKPTTRRSPLIPTLHIELDLRLPALDVQPVVRSRLAPVQPHHVPADVLQPEAAVGRLHHGRPRWHQQVLFRPRPQHRRTRLAVHHQAHQLGVAALSHADHLTSGWNRQHRRRDWRGDEGRERGNLSLFCSTYIPANMNNALEKYDFS